MKISSPNLKGFRSAPLYLPFFQSWKKIQIGLFCSWAMKVIAAAGFKSNILKRVGKEMKKKIQRKLWISIQKDFCTESISPNVKQQQYFQGTKAFSIHGLGF